MGNRWFELVRNFDVTWRGRHIQYLSHLVSGLELSWEGEEGEAVALLESAMFGRFASFVSSSSTDPLAPRLFFLPLFVIYTRLIIISCKILPSFLTVPGTFRKGALRFKIQVRTVCAHACWSICAGFYCINNIEASLLQWLNFFVNYSATTLKVKIFVQWPFGDQLFGFSCQGKFLGAKLY